MDPLPEPDAPRIAAVVKHGNEVTGYKLSNGRLVSKEEGIAMVKNGEIMGVDVAEERGTEYLRALPDDVLSPNMEDLPVIDDTRQGMY